LPLPCLRSPRRCAASASSLPSLVGDKSCFPGIYSMAVSAVAFVFFPQVGLRVAPHLSEAAADRPTAPWFGRRVVKPYLMPSWSGPSGRRCAPLVQSNDRCRDGWIILHSPLQWGWILAWDPMRNIATVIPWPPIWQDDMYDTGTILCSRNHDEAFAHYRSKSFWVVWIITNSEKA
jgi:hypothetical protein